MWNKKASEKSLLCFLLLVFEMLSLKVSRLCLCIKSKFHHSPHESYMDGQVLVHKIFTMQLTWQQGTKRLTIIKNVQWKHVWTLKFRGAVLSSTFSSQRTSLWSWSVLWTSGLYETLFEEFGMLLLAPTSQVMEDVYISGHQYLCLIFNLCLW